MKLFAFCFGVALAATAASATVVAGETQQGTYAPWEVCQEDWFATENHCFSDEWNPINDKCRQYNDTNYLTKGICCGSTDDNSKNLNAEEISFCKEAAEHGCLLSPSQFGNCGQCLFFKPEVPEELFPEIIGGCCQNDCCNEAEFEPLSYLDTILNADCDALEYLKSWSEFDVHNDLDVFIGPRVTLCSSKPYTLPVKLTTESVSSVNFDCYELCCPCCYNLEVTTKDKATDLLLGENEHGCSSTIEYVQHYASAGKRTVYQGGASICVGPTSEQIALFSNHAGLVALNSNDTNTTFSATFSCSKKTDGGNAGYPLRNGTNYTNPVYTS